MDAIPDTPRCLCPIPGCGREHADAPAQALQAAARTADGRSLVPCTACLVQATYDALLMAARLPAGPAER